jgi:methanogenic corrinoid protein MtbC1
MSSELDDQTGLLSLSDMLTGRAGRVPAQEHVTALATEVLNQVARRAVELRKARDKAAVKSAAIALTTGSEEQAAAALESLDDPLHGLDWFLAERLGPIAKEIGDLWTADKVSFLEATVGASRIYSFLRYRRRPPLVQERGVRKSATFALVPGDMHTLGISAATDVFRARGWDITLLIGHSHEELLSHFESSTDLLFGFSAGSNHTLESLGRLVVALTVARPEASVMVSGQIATDPVAVMALPGVDFCDADLESASRWFEMQTQHRAIP